MKIGKAEKCISIKVYIELAEADVAGFLETYAPFTEAVLAEEGCLEFTLYNCAGSTNKFFLYEEYKDQAAFDAHLNSQHVKDFFAYVPTVASLKMDAVIYDSVKRA
ncbi:MAG: putative quinol monooxygenase [Opitutales bacterium]